MAGASQKKETPQAEAPAKPAPVLKVAPPAKVKSEKQLKADQLLLDARAKRLGVDASTLVMDETPVEDWEEDLKVAKVAADPDLAGLYRIVHGNIFFESGKIARTGRKVRLTAEDARQFLAMEFVQRVGD